MIDGDTILQWLPLLNVVVIPLVGWLIKTLRKDLATKHDLHEVADRLAQNEQRTALVERDLAHLPSNKDFISLREGLSKLSGETIATHQQLTAVGTAVRRIEDYLMKSGRER